MASADPFRKLIKLVARAFYDDEVPTKSAPTPGKPGKENKGISVVVLDALTRRQWVKEEELAKSLKLHAKQLRRTLRILEEEQLVVREDRKETVKGAKVYNAAVAATRDVVTGQEQDKAKVMLHSYCSIDYSKVCDVIRYRIHRAKRMIKDQLEDRNTVQEYICPEASCGKRYTALDAASLMSEVDMNFHCEKCDAELVAESDKIATTTTEAGDGDSEETARRRHRERLKDMLERLEVQLKPIQDQLMKLKDLPPPDYGSFAEWQERALAQARPPSDDNDRGNGEHSGRAAMPLGDTKVEVALPGSDPAKSVKDEAAALKVLPPWMIREGMNLTSAQRGEVAKGTDETKPEPKPATEEAANNLQEEYLKAYYAAYLQQQQQQEEQEEQQEPQIPDNLSVEEPPAEEDEREVGEKSKRPPDDEDDIEWEDDGGEAAAPTEEKPPEEGSDDEIDWE